jgi:hypothetical protein
MSVAYCIPLLSSIEESDSELVTSEIFKPLLAKTQVRYDKTGKSQKLAQTAKRSLFSFRRAGVPALHLK